MRIIALIDEAEVIERILRHLGLREGTCRDAMTEAGKGAFLPDKEPEALRTITKNHETRPPR